MVRRGTRSVVRLLASASMLGVLSATAQTGNWANPVSGDWFDSSKWVGGVPSGASATAILGATGAGHTVSLDTSLVLSSLQLTSSAATLALGDSAALSFSGSTESANFGTITLGNFASLSGSGKSLLHNSGSIRLLHSGAAYSWGAGLTISNTGTLEQVGLLAGTSTFLGTLHNSGTFKLLPQSPMQSLTISGGIHSGTFLIGSGAQLVLTGNHTIQPGANFSGGGSLLLAGTTIINTAWNAPGINLVSTGGMTSFNQPVTSQVNVNGGTVEFNSTMSGGIVASGGTCYVRPAASHWSSGVLTGGTWSVSGSGNLSLTTGSILTNAANVRLTGSNAAFSSLSNLSTNSGTLILDGASWPLGSSGLLTNSGYFNRAGAGTTFIPNSRAISNTGTISVSGGTMVIGASGNFPIVTPTTLTGGNWMVSNDGWLGFGSVIGGGTITQVASNTSVTLDGSAAQLPAMDYLLNNQGTFAVRGGKAFFSKSNLINSGTLVVGAGSEWLANGSLALQGGKLLISSDNASPGVFKMLVSVSVPPLGFSPVGAEISSTGAGSLAGTVDMMNKSGVFDVANNPIVAIDLDVSARLTNGNLTKSGVGVMRISGQNTYQGPTHINSGTLLLGAPATLPVATKVDFGTLASPLRYLDMAGNAQTIDSIAGTGTILLGGATLTVGGSGSSTFNGMVLGTGTFRKTGSGTLFVPGVLNHDGPLNVSDGTLVLNTAAEDSFTGPITVSGGQLYAQDAALGDPLFNPVFLTGGTLVFGGSSVRDITISNSSTMMGLGAGTIGGNLNGSGTLNFTDLNPSGTMTINGNASFSGNVNIDGAKVKLDGGLARMPNVPSFRVSVGGTGGSLHLDRSTPAPAPPPSSGPAPSGGMQDIRLNGGTLQVSGQTSTSTTESFGALFLEGGASTIQTSPGAGGTLTLNFGSFGPRGSGATVNWIAANPGVTDKIKFSSGVPVGFIGSYFTINGTDFAKYDATLGVLPFTSGDYSSGFVRDTHVLLNAGATVPDTTVNLPDPFNIRTLNLASTGSLDVVVPSSTTLQISEGGIIKSGAGTATLSGGTVTWGGNELNISVSGGALDISSTIVRTGGGTYTLTKRGTGTLTLSGGNSSSYSGVTMISGLLDLNKPAGTNAIPGDLVISGGIVRSLANQQIADTGKITLNAGLFNLNGFAETVSTVTNNAGTIQLFGGTLTTTSTTLNGGTTNIASTLNASGTLAITGGENTVSTSGVVNVGTLQLSGATSAAITLSSGTASSGQLILSGNVIASPTAGTLKIASSGAGATPGKLDLGGAVRTFTVLSGASREDLIVSAQIVTGGLTKTGPGMMQVSGSNTYAMGTTINAGTLEGVSTAAFGTGSIQFGVGTTTVGTLGLRSDASIATFGNAIAAGGTARPIFIDINRITAGAANKFVLGTATLGSNLTVTGAGTLQLGAVHLTSATVINPYGAALTLNAGIHGAGESVIYGGPAASPGGSLPGSGGGNSGDPIGTITLNGSTASGHTGLTTVDGGAFLALDQTPGAYSIVGPINLVNGTIMCYQSDQFAHTVDMSMTTPGGVFDLNGTVQTLHDLTLQAGTVKTNGGTLNVTGTITTPPPAGSLPIGAGTPLIAIASVQGNLSLSPGTILNLVSASDQVTIDANVTATGGFSVTGAGQLSLNGTNTIGGTISLNGGTINALTSASLGAATIVLDGGILNASGTISNRVVLGASGAQIPVPSQQTLTFTQPLTGAGMTKSGSGTLVLAGASSFAGNVNLVSGTLQIASDGNLGVIANTVNLNGGNLTYSQSLGTTRAFNLNGGAIAVAAGQTVSLDGSSPLSGTGRLIKTGPGTLVVNRPRSYQDATQVSGGTLSFATQPPELLAGGTLTAGTWIVEGGSTLTLAGPAITTNKASITLRGQNSIFSNLASFNRNEGNFAVDAGRLFTTAGAFTNTGTMAVGFGGGVKINASLSNTGTIDLAAAMVVDYASSSPIASLRAQVLSGYNSGSWRGIGINSSIAAGDASKGIAVAEATESGVLFSQISTDATSVILLLTTRGDANLDSQVNSLDFNRFASNYGKASSLWSEGDFDYDGRINTSDFNYLAGSFGAASSTLPSSAIPQAAQGLGSVVPEPGVLAWTSGISCLALRRRIRK